VCATNCTNELNYFAHTIGLGLRYKTPVGPIRIDLGYQLNRPSFVIPIQCPSNTTSTTCPVGSLGQQGTRLPGFKSFSIWGRASSAQAGHSRSCGFAAPGGGAGVVTAQEIVDRVAARIENDIILLSDIRALSRYQQFLDGKSETDGQILDRLIDQWIVRTEANVSRFPQPSAADIERSVERVRKSFPSTGSTRPG